MTEDPMHASRRRFLATAALAPAVLVPASQTGDRSPEELANIRIVADFCASWSSLDISRPLSFMAPDCVYRMSERVEPVDGHQGVRDRLQSFVEASEAVEFEVLETFAAGPIVINRRIDRFVSTTRPVTWQGVGVFYVEDGKIREWSDYTIRVGP